MRKNLIKILLFFFISIFLFYNCKKENKENTTAALTNDESLNSLAVKLSQNTDFQNLVTGFPGIRKECATIFKSFLQNKKDINALSVEEKKLLGKQLQESEIIQASRTFRQNIRNTFPVLKNLSRSDSRTVYLKAMGEARKLLKTKRSFEGTLRSNFDPSCEDSCMWAYGERYDGCDESAIEDLDQCDETFSLCEETCLTLPAGPQRNECMTICEDNQLFCELIAFFDHQSCYDGVDDMIEQCIMENCMEDND